MFLKEFSVSNFRGIDDVTLHFNKGLNVLIGENNSSKTAIIDALRICLSFGNQRRDVYVGRDDFYIDVTQVDSIADSIEFYLNFQLEEDEVLPWFNDLRAIDGEGNESIQLHIRYYIKDNDKIRYNIYGGNVEAEQPVDSEALALIYHIHLGALRDAVNSLRPVRGNRLGELYSKIQIKDSKEEDIEHKNALAAKLKETLGENEDWKNLIKKGKTRVNEHLSKTTIAGKEQKVDIDFLPFGFGRLIQNLRIQMPIYSDEILGGDSGNQRYFDLYQNGLGINNLIYIATALGDLKQRRESEQESFVALLIEEPESHLHPQLQNILFNYLAEIDKTLGFQVFLSSHSPTLTAKAELDSLIVLQNQENTISALSMKASALTGPNKKYLHKFLDVTKAQLFFANGIILVEGISEALLLPVFSKIMGEQYNLEKNGIEVVNVNGVAFDHFANLFNSTEQSKRLACRCSILTDDDRDDASENDEISSRAEKAIGLGGGNLKTELTRQTFEYELFISGNKDILLDIFKEMHPIAARRIVEGETIEDHAHSFLEKVVSNKAKSELSHRLALHLETDEDAKKAFVVPECIKNAVKHVTAGE